VSNPYIVKLDRLLQEIPREERQEILQDYLEHFRLAQAEGKTQEEIADALGSVEALAADILAEYQAGRAAAPVEITPQATPVPWWRTAGIMVLTAVLFIGLIWAFVGIRMTSSTDPAPPEPSPADTVDQLKQSLKAYSSGLSTEPASTPPASPEAKKTGGTVIINEERKAADTISSLQIETVDTEVVIETAKDAKLQALLDGKMTVREGEDWTDYYDFGTDSSGGTFTVYVRVVEAKKNQMPSGRKTTLRILLPEAPLEKLDVSTVSASVKAPALQAGQFNGATVSGNIDLAGLKGKNHHMTNVSGKISIDSLSGDFAVDSVSGSVRISGTSWESAGSVNTVSGSVNLTADAKLPFAYELNSVSGSVKCGFEGASASSILMLKQCSGSTGESKRTLTLTSISGPLQVGP
jgi:DUF4097 and DUF4098 domain-containing protein YvlB